MLIASSQNERCILKDCLCARVASACSRKTQCIARGNGLSLTHFALFQNERGVIANSTQPTHQLPIGGEKSIGMRFGLKSLLSRRHHQFPVQLLTAVQQSWFACVFLVSTTSSVCCLQTSTHYSSKPPSTNYLPNCRRISPSSTPMETGKLLVSTGLPWSNKT